MQGSKWWEQFGNDLNVKHEIEFCYLGFIQKLFGFIQRKVEKRFADKEQAEIDNQVHPVDEKKEQEKEPQMEVIDLGSTCSIRTIEPVLEYDPPLNTTLKGY